MTDGERIRAALAHGHRFAAERHECPKCEALADLDALLARLHDAERERDDARECAESAREHSRLYEAALRESEARGRQLEEVTCENVGDAYNLLTQGESPTQRRGPSAQRIYDRSKAALAAVGPADRNEAT